MPVVRTYPGVYIEEISSGVRTIIGVATSITAFIGRAPRGPTDRPGRVQNFADFERMYGGLWVSSTLGYAVQQFFDNGGSDALIVRVHKNAAPATQSAYPTLSLKAANEGKWGDKLMTRVDWDVGDPTDTQVFNLSVYHADLKITERFRNVALAADHPRSVKRVLEDESRFIRVSGTVGATIPPADPVIPVTALDDPFKAPYWKPFAGGVDGNDITAAEVLGSEAAQTGLYMLDKADIFNLLCIPPYTRDSDIEKTTWSKAAAYCEKRRAVLLIDAPSSWATPADAATKAPNDMPSSHSAAVYFPRIMAPDPLREFKLESFAPSGAVAGAIARTDAQRGIWKAPAGLDATLSGVSALSLGRVPALITDPQIGLLNPLGVNCLRTVPGAGQVVWGARTLRGADKLASEWKYLPVRRLAYYIEETLFRGTEWAVFEPNDEPLWAQIRMNVGTFMQGLFRQGAFQGVSPREAYFVKCSRETTTQADIDAGTVNVLVGFAPLKPAEFIVIRIQQMAQQPT